MNDLVINPMKSTGMQTGGSTATADSNRAIAEVQAALTVAMAHPRDQVKAMDRIINAFTRPGLAETSQYQFSRGGTDISGPSIRSAEAIAQQWGNFQFGFRELSRSRGLDGIGVSEVSALAWDMEANTIRTIAFHVRHWRDTKSGGYALKDERDIYELIANQAQRRVRSCILAVIPGDVVDSAMQQAALTLKSTADTSPEAMQKMLNAFECYHVTKEQIEARVQRRIDAIQPAQVVMLKRIYASLRDGMGTPAEWFDSEESEPEKLENDQIKSLNESLKTEKKKPGRPKKEAEKKPEEKRVTYAEMMDIIIKADDAKAIIEVFNTSSFKDLPEDQRIELDHAGQIRIEKITKKDQ